MNSNVNDRPTSVARQGAMKSGWDDAKAGMAMPAPHWLVKRYESSLQRQDYLFGFETYWLIHAPHTGD